jgi:hypothetical protein
MILNKNSKGKKMKSGEWWKFDTGRTYVLLGTKDGYHRRKCFIDSVYIKKSICVGCQTLGVTMPKSRLARRVTETELKALTILFPNEML